jgi:diaminopimelate epimerase
MPTWPILKAHAYGNDFLYVEDDTVAAIDLPAFAREVCARQTGIGADGLIAYHRTPDGASMRLFNADGSRAEVSGNGVRGLAAAVVDVHKFPTPDGLVVVHTDAGPKTLTLVGRDRGRPVFRAAMGHPAPPVEVDLVVDGSPLRLVVLNVGNPQCVRLEADLSDERMRRLGPLLERHPAFPDRTNVEFATVDAADRVRILIWERGAGPTMASGTGACAAAVAASVFGGAGRDMTVTSPGGSQRVEWLPDGLYLTGWAEVVLQGHWLR